ncbi:MAG: hypothetical protein AUK47_28025 [Deltaproteobacteria bacterium CG2_30_63_29]|nr:MAG: hypothetical protein AUK47_28025 [Deltaproteobacteria bacterium CG2_30_63_29]PIW02338.1 MAG: hypothetical protein COW42_02140 [Deltaproteobacteria bacterium CG17_big_fil_post_rev_8_21_14_2_50_63_7]PJB36660.1 MAG: hypothetical protein CO108_22845 [Deltaproteobacteria bacterium CG_4_9_14_3_um_filter_63_12]
MNDERICIEEHQKLVADVANDLARQYRLRRFLDDLVAYGMEGLLEAHRRFDPSKGCSFTTYAWYRIRGHILDGCRSMGLVARTRRRRLQADTLVNDHLSVRSEDQEQTSSPTLASVAADLDTMVGDVATIVLLMDEPTDKQEPRFEGPTPEEEVGKAFDEAWLRKQVDTLDEPGRTVIFMSFYEDKSLDEISLHFDITRGWASRLRTNAIEKLRRRLMQVQKEMR